jgi:diadenylate cyclase
VFNLLWMPINTQNWAEWMSHWKNLFQFVLVFFVFMGVYYRIRGTTMAQLVRGFALLFSGYLLTSALNLTIISTIFQVVLQIGIIGFIILFQPELRRLIVSFGQSDWFNGAFSQGTDRAGNDQYTHLIHELVEASKFLSRTKTGALIVLVNNEASVKPYLDAGTAIHAKVSTELLLTIFHTNTPLHDGAVIISTEGQLKSAGVLLPLSDNPNLSWKFGTRHRAAIGLSEVSDASVLIISEETGHISIARHGELLKMTTQEALREFLETLYGISAPNSENPVFDMSELLSTERKK